ncbi:MAG: aminopeptidase P family protein [Rhodospirillaceae bacterium]|nr:aminopeptidase P family protein [Rhodospirillaceae bacterium]
MSMDAALVPAAEGQVFKDARKRAFLNPEGADRPLKSPIPKSTLIKARGYRKQRLVDQVVAHDCAAILLYDPINVRYALDVSNMQLWATHNPFHYALLFADGHAIEFAYRGAEHLAAGFETVNEVRPGNAWFYMYTADRLQERVDAWADEIVSILKERNGGNMRLAIDKLDPPGLDALRRRGVAVVEGQALTEIARAVKSAEELELMRWTVRVCEAGMARMYEHSLPGRTEQEIWAELHYENIRSGGEWLETRLLTVGSRTNPWFQECSDHVACDGDMLGFDTDMIGPYGYCADLSRSWTIGHRRMNGRQRDLYAAARDQIEHNLALLTAGLSFDEFNAKSWRIPEKYLGCRYSVVLHGVGMADEYPSLPLHPDWQSAYRGTFVENMTVCVESLIGEAGVGECVKLETQVVITAEGARRLDSFPWEEVD